MRSKVREIPFDVLALGFGLALFALNTFFLKPCLAGSESMVALLMRNYANDLLGGFAFLAYTNLLFDLVKPAYRVTKVRVAIPYIFACGLFWEFIAPLFVARSVTDWFDLIAYVVGAFIYIVANRLLMPTS